MESQTTSHDGRLTTSLVRSFLNADSIEDLAISVVTIPRELWQISAKAALIAAAITFLSKGFVATTRWVAQVSTVSVQLHSSDEAFEWVLGFLESNTSFRHSGHVVGTTKNVQGKIAGAPPDGAPQVRFKTAPARGGLPHLFWFMGRPVAVRLSVLAEKGSNPPGELLQLSSVRLLNGLSSLQSLVNQARSRHLKEVEHGTSVYTAACEYGSWNAAVQRKARRLSSVIHPKGMMILQDCQEFLRLETEAWYSARGIPYRRGYLFYGVPGSGKTSLVFALAGELHTRIYCIPISSPKLEDESLRDLMSLAPPQALLLLEDVDACSNITLRREGHHDAAEGNNGLTLAGLLNAVDGVAAQEGRLLFMTTNHIQVLDPALIRPGRIDVRLEFKYACRAEAHAFVLHFLGDTLPISEVEHLAESLAVSIPENCVTIAELQGLLLRFREKPSECIESIPSFLTGLGIISGARNVS